MTLTETLKQYDWQTFAVFETLTEVCQRKNKDKKIFSLSKNKYINTHFPSELFLFMALV